MENAIPMKITNTNFHIENGLCSVFGKSINSPWPIIGYTVSNNNDGRQNLICDISKIDFGNFKVYPCKLLKDVRDENVGYGERHYSGDCGFIGSNGIFFGGIGYSTFSVYND